MAGNETEINLRFKVNDDGSIILDKIGKGIEKVGQQTEKMNSSLGIIKFDSIVNLGQKVFSTAQQFITFAEAGARVRAVEDSFAIMARSAGVSADNIILDLKKVTAETIDDSDLMAKAMRLISESFSTEQIGGIGEAARASARLMGISVSEAYDQIADSVLNLRERGLKTAGIVIDMDAAYRKHAETLGVGKDDLNQYGKQMALVNAVTEKAAELHDRLGISVETAFEKMQKSKTAWKGFWENISKGASEGLELVQDLMKKISSVGGGLNWAALEPERMAQQKFFSEEEHGQAGRAAAFAPLKSQVDETVALKRHAADLKMFREVDLQLLKDQEATLKRMVDLQGQLNKSANEAIDIANRLGIGTKAALTQWVESDIVGEYEKLLGSKLFSGAEMEQFKERYTDALKGAMEGGWGSEYKQIEEAIKRISTMKVEDTSIEKTRVEFEKLQKTAQYLEKFTGQIKLDDDDVVRARDQISGLRDELTRLVNQSWNVTLSIYGYGSSEMPIMEKISQVTNAFQNMGSEVGNMVLTMNMEQLNAAIAQEKATIMYAQSPALSRYGTSLIFSSRYWEKKDEEMIARSKANMAELERSKVMLAAGGAYAAAQAAPAAAAPMEGGGGYGGGNISVNIGNIYVNGENAAAIAQDLDAQLADMYLRDRSKLKNAIETGRA